YYARVTAAAGSNGLLSQYVLAFDLADTLPPTVAGTSLPAEGGTTAAVVDRFSLTFSEDMAPDTVNNVANFDLRSAGPDDTFGTPDDVRYTLAAPGYTAGTTVQYRITDGPLQPGRYRLTVSTALTDRAGNPLASPFVRIFTAAALPGFTLENRNNDTPATATPLTLTESPAGLRAAFGQ